MGNFFFYTLDIFYSIWNVKNEINVYNDAKGKFITSVAIFWKISIVYLFFTAQKQKPVMYIYGSIT